MSKCISREGEYSDHVIAEGGFECGRCHVFDEEAALTRIGILEAALASTPSPAQPTEVTLSVGSVKMLRETLCAAQATVARSASDRAQEHSARIGEFIAQLDTHRPLGADGKHGDLHTLTCGCDDGILAPSPAQQAAADRITEIGVELGLIAPSPVQDADDRLAQAAREWLAVLDAERQTDSEAQIKFEILADLLATYQQSPQAALNEVRANERTVEDK